MTQDFIFAQDVILDPDTGKSVAVVRNIPLLSSQARAGPLSHQQSAGLSGQRPVLRAQVTEMSGYF
jgi:hypothetical protein